MAWRRRPCRCCLKLALAGVVAAVLLTATTTLLGQEEDPGGEEATPEDDEVRPDASYLHLEGPGLVQVGVAGPGGLLGHLLPGRGAPLTIVSLNTSWPPSPALHCLTTRTVPRFPVCPHPAAHDRYISAQLLRDGTWEPQILSLFSAALHNYPGSTVVDLGAHVGVYSLLGARLGSRVVAVEPVWASAVRLHAGAAAAGVAGSLTILLHALTLSRRHARLKYRAGNLGGTSVVEVTRLEADQLRATRPRDLVTSLTLDDLMPFVNTSVVLLKIDVEGWECGAVLGGRSFLTAHFAPYIFVEWAVVANNRHKYHAPCRSHHLQQMVSWLAAHSYLPYISKSGAPLVPAKMETWHAGDIYWRHTSAPRLHPEP